MAQDALPCRRYMRSEPVQQLLKPDPGHTTSASNDMDEGPLPVSRIACAHHRCPASTASNQAGRRGGENSITVSLAYSQTELRRSLGG